MTSGSNNSKVLDDPVYERYNVPIKGYMGKKKKTIFYVIVNGWGQIKQYSCQHVNEMLEVSHEEVLHQIEMYLLKKKIK